MSHLECHWTLRMFFEELRMAREGLVMPLKVFRASQEGLEMLLEGLSMSEETLRMYILEGLEYHLLTVHLRISPCTVPLPIDRLADCLIVKNLRETTRE